MKNHGQFAALVVASALLVDYVLTVAVSVSAGTDNIISAFPALNEYRVPIAVGLVVLLAAANLRGVRESGQGVRRPDVPVHQRHHGHDRHRADPVTSSPTPGSSRRRAEYTVTPEPGYGQVAGLALIFFALRAFASGCTALTGVEAIANGVPAFKPPKSRNAATTLALMGGIAAAMFAGVTALALLADVKYVEHPCDLEGFAQLRDRAAADRHRAARRGHVRRGQLDRLLLHPGRDGADPDPGRRTPRSTASRCWARCWRRTGSCPGSCTPAATSSCSATASCCSAGFAILLIVVFDADVSQLIQLYIIGVFTSFTIGQWGMVRHWNREMRRARTRPPAGGCAGRRSSTPSAAALTTVVLVIIVLTKFTHGAWLVLVAMPILFVLMKAINRHYSHVSEQLIPDTDSRLLPSKVHAVVLVSKVHKPTLRALAFARATRPDALTALTVNVDDADTRACRPTGSATTSRCRSPWSSRRTARSPAGASTSSRASAGTARASWSWCSCRSTSLATGGRTCCTTRARCACAPVCSSSPAS